MASERTYTDSDLAAARASISRLRDAVREGQRIDFRERDEYVMLLHGALDELQRLRDHAAQPAPSPVEAVAAERERVLALIDESVAKYLNASDQLRFREVVDWIKMDARGGGN